MQREKGLSKLESHFKGMQYMSMHKLACKDYRQMLKDCHTTVGIGLKYEYEYFN